MASFYDDLLEEALARLQALPAWGPLTGSIRRKHRTAVTRENTPAAHLVDAVDEPVGRNKSCATTRRGAFTVVLYVRDDEGLPLIDLMKCEVMRRLCDGNSPAYPHNARLEPGRIIPDTAIADQDAIRLDMEFTFHYQVRQWTLDEAV